MMGEKDCHFGCRRKRDAEPLLLAKKQGFQVFVSDQGSISQSAPRTMFDSFGELNGRKTPTPFPK